MTDKGEKDHGPRDPSTVNLSDESAVRWWCKELGCTRRRLFAAVKAVGPMTTRVKHYLNGKQ